MSVNRHHLMELKEILGDEFGPLLETYLSDSRSRLDKALAYLGAAEWESARREFHCLKGSSANIGALSFSAACQQLELQLKNDECPQVGEHESNLEGEYHRVVAALTEVLTNTDNP